MIAQKRSLVSATSDYNYGLWLTGTCNLFFQFHDGAYRNYTDTQTIPLNRWSFVAVTVDESNTILNFYYNSTLSSSPAYAGVMPSAGTAPVQIGRYSFGAYGFVGDIDDVRIYNRVLSATEVAMLANNRNQIRNAGINNGQVK